MLSVCREMGKFGLEKKKVFLPPQGEKPQILDATKPAPDIMPRKSFKCI